MTAPLLTQALLVGAGGFIGSALRFLLGGWVQRLSATAAFPFGTLAVNVLGCLLIGMLAGFAESRQALEPGMRLFLIAGVLGGFTTYSAFAFESIALIHDAEYGRALINVALQIFLGLGAAFLGHALMRG